MQVGGMDLGQIEKGLIDKMHARYRAVFTVALSLPSEDSGRSRLSCETAPGSV